MILQGYRKKLDLWGTDWYLAHIYRQAKWWASPTHTVVLGDLLGSQWIGDGEFESRAERFWSRVFGTAERVPDNVTAKEHELEVLGVNARDWRRRVIAVAGNHDVGYAGDLSEARIERFERAFGRVNWELSFRLPNATLDPKNTLAGQKVPDFYDGPAPQPELRLVVLNSMNLDEPAQSPALREQSLKFMQETLCNPDRRHSEHSATVLLTHIPLHKPTGICVDGPFFSYFSNGGVREQNHLSEDLSKRLVECLQNTQSSIVLNGHDHEGCDSFHYRDTGQGVPFVFQHGLGGDAAQTFGLFAPPPGYRLITLECRGHGDTRPLGDPDKLSLGVFVDDLCALLEHLALPQVVVGGISMGAAVALMLTLRRPERVRGLVLSRPAWLDAPLPPNAALYPVIARLIREHGAAQGLERFLNSAEYCDIEYSAPDAARSLRGSGGHDDRENPADHSLPLLRRRRCGGGVSGARLRLHRTDARRNPQRRHACAGQARRSGRHARPGRAR